MQYLCLNCGGEIFSKTTLKNIKLKIIKCNKCYELCMNAWLAMHKMVGNDELDNPKCSKHV